MIKDRQVYEDVYSNGNIMCVTGEGGMFTAPAGMTTDEMLNRDVKDTYCLALPWWRMEEPMRSLINFGRPIGTNGRPWEWSILETIIL